jgi:hypothetical protein
MVLYRVNELLIHAKPSRMPTCTRILERGRSDDTGDDLKQCHSNANSSHSEPIIQNPF